MKEHENRFQRIDERLNTLETKMVEIQTRINRKHDEIKGIQKDIFKERENTVNLLKAVTELTTIQKELNKDMRDIEGKVDELNEEVVRQKSSSEAFRWIVALGVPIFVTVITYVLEHFRG